MKGTVNIHIARLRFILAALMMLSLASCRRDSLESGLAIGSQKVTLYPAIARSVENVILTRAINVKETRINDEDQPYSIYSPYPELEVNGTQMRVYAVPADPELENRTFYHALGSFRYSNDTWHSSVSAYNDLTYYLFAISPINLPGATTQTFNWGVDGSFNADNITLSFDGLDIITTSDPMVSIAAKGKHVKKVSGQLKEVISENPEVLEDLTDPTLDKGDYNIGKVHVPDENATDDYYRVWMAMDRLYAKATLSFSIDPGYNNLRTIRIKSLKITTKCNGEPQPSHLPGPHTYKFAQGEDFLNGNRLTLAKPNDGFSSTKVLSIDLMDPSNPAVIDNRDLIDPDDPNSGRQDYATLKVPKGNGDYWEFGSFQFLPQASLPSGLIFPTIYLDVEYDVYSKAGTKVRSDHVTNAISLSSIYLDTNVDYAPAAGDNIKIKIMVKPTYIYQLADDDVMFDIRIVQ